MNHKRIHGISLIAFLTILVCLIVFSLLTRKKWETTRNDVVGEARTKLEEVLKDYKGATELSSDSESGTIDLTFLNSGILFETDSDALKPGASEFVAKLRVAMGGFTHVVVTGHADNTGTDKYNFDLSERRAQAVRSELIRFGTDPDSIFSFGQGFYKPRTSNETEEGRAQNRRVELKLIYGNIVAMEEESAIDEFYASIRGPMYGLWVVAAIALIGAIINVGVMGKKKEEASKPKETPPAA